jgi:N-acetylneuraminate synthase
VGVAVGGVALGATVVEKHLTISRRDGGVDSSFSMEPAELGQLVDETQRVWRALGTVNYGPTAVERESLRFRRSLYVVRDVRAGEALSPDNVRAIRPGLGLAPKFLQDVLGRRAAVDIQKGTPLTWEIVG